MIDSYIKCITKFRLPLYDTGIKTRSFFIKKHMLFVEFTCLFFSGKLIQVITICLNLS